MASMSMNVLRVWMARVANLLQSYRLASMKWSKLYLMQVQTRKLRASKAIHPSTGKFIVLSGTESTKDRLKRLLTKVLLATTTICLPFNVPRGFQLWLTLCLTRPKFVSSSARRVARDLSDRLTVQCPPAEASQLLATLRLV
jgi:hypothetical protein